MNILITGGLGYIGSAFLREISPSMFESVRVLDNLSTGRMANVANLSEETLKYKLEIMVGDIRTKEEDVYPAMENIDIVVHLAAITSLRHYNSQLIGETRSVNLSGTETLLDVAEDCGVRKFIYASTCGVYGNSDRLNLTEESPPNPGNPYQRTKYLAEKEVLQRKSLSPLVYRLSSQFGWSPGLRDNLVINKFVMLKVQNEPLTIYGRGDEWRPYIHVKDTARAFIHGIEKDLEGVYNVGGVNLTASMISDLLHYTNVTYYPYEGKRDSHHCSFEKIKKTGFSTSISVSEGIRDLERRFGL